jgi:ribosomal protein S18 acetylase RimI-like enzyme
MASTRKDELNIRLARLADAEAIAVMSRDAIENGLGWSWRPQRVAASIRDPQSLCCVAGLQSIRGFCITQFGEERAHLSLLAVEAGLRRKGFGRRLVQWTLESARVAGIAAIHVEMRTNNTVAQAFYRSLGFERAGLVPGYYRGVEAAERMVLRLRPDGFEAQVWEVPRSWRRQEGRA